MSTESDAVDDAIADVAVNPKKMEGDMGALEEFSLDELIRAAKYLKNKDATANNYGWKMTKIEAPAAHP